MAYTITLFVRTSDPVAQRAAEDLVGQLSQRNPSLTGIPSGDGVGWASYELITGRDLRAQMTDFERDLLPREPRAWPISITVDTRPDFVKRQIAWGLENGGPLSLGSCDGVVEVTLVGDLHDWDLVELLCDIATERWNAIICDDHDGFGFGQ